MPKQHLRLLANGLIGLGLLLCLGVAVSALAEAQQTAPEAAAPFDQSDADEPEEVGFVPYLVPPTALGVPQQPTLPAPLTPRPLWPATAQPPDLGQAPVVTAGPSPTSTPLPRWPPDRLVIPAIKLDVPVVGAKIKTIVYEAQTYQQWVAPNALAAGWLTTSASLGVVGNTVLIGHHNTHGEVFAHLADLRVGDALWVYAGPQVFTYTLAARLILPERFQPLAVRLQNAQWIAAFADERLTLVTCWPYASNTHRLILIARPATLGHEAILTPRLTPRP